jgi:uncharacterized protein (TIGR02145 family)
LYIPVNWLINSLFLAIHEKQKTMRKTACLFLLIFTLTKLQAQDYLISFAGSGVSTTVDSVIVQNLTQGTSLTVGSGNQLHLLGTLSIFYPFSEKTKRSLLVYPNPTDDDVILIFEATSDAHVIIEVSDFSGQMVLKTQSWSLKGRQSFRISGLNSGTYLVQIQSETYHYTGKIISSSTSSKTARLIRREQTNDPADPDMKIAEAVIQMQYTNGDLIKFTGKSSGFGTVIMDVPIESKIITFNFVSCTDYDDNSYHVVQIGDQLWMAENLRTTKYGNGEEIPEVTEASTWGNLSTGAFCYFGNDPANAPIFGCLYNWFAVIDSRNLCPYGWHVPTDAEWTTLTDYLGGEVFAGGKLKETGFAHWSIPNSGATNETGFSALPGGLHFGNVGFSYLGYYGYWWSSTDIDAGFAWRRHMGYDYSYFFRDDFNKKSGFSVRCLKD